MRPIPIPDELVPDGAIRTVLSAPNGDLTDDQIAPLEVVIEELRHGDVETVMWTSRWTLTDEERERVAAGEAIEISLIGMGSHPPIYVEVAP